MPEKLPGYVLESLLQNPLVSTDDAEVCPRSLAFVLKIFDTPSTSSPAGGMPDQA